MFIILLAVGFPPVFCSPISTTHMPATNELLQEGRYRIDQRAPGSDNVFEAYDTVRNTPVVVREIPVRMNKVMTASQQESLKIAFTNQAKALQELEHESLLPVHDFFSEIDRQYLVMEAVEGQDLAELLATNRRPFPVSDITRWADELLDALNYLHTRRPSIIHRNIRPDNLKLSNGKVKLFGVGLDGGPDEGSSEDLRYSPMEQIWPGLDAASQKVITNSYDDRSERILKEPLDARSDIYSLGATLYFLATGCEPVDPLERSIDLLEGKLDPLREPTSVNSQIAPEISDVLMKALEIKRENRYDSALIMRQVLQSAIARVEEREEREAAEQQEAAEALRQAKFGPPPAPPVFEEPPVVPAPVFEAKFETPAPEQPRVEAKFETPAPEQPRVEVEQTTEVSAPAANFLDLPAAAEVLAYREHEAVDEDELSAVLKELEEAESKSSVKEEHTPLAAPAPPVVEPAPPVVDHAEVEHVDAVVDSDPVPAFATSAYQSEDDEDDEDDAIFSVTEKPGFSLPVPAIAGAVGLVIVIAVGAWFTMSGSSGDAKPSPAQVEVPAPVEPAGATTDPIVSSQSEDPNANAAVATETSADQAGVQKGPTPKAKKNEPAKTPEKKKAVTVDDLINDN